MTSFTSWTHHLPRSLFLLLVMGTSTPLAARQVLQGEIEGAPYRIEVPDDWNGDLVLLQHGYIFPGAKITIPPADHAFFNPLSAELAARGFAVAYSAYSTNGFAVKEGAKDTVALAQHFEQQLGAPGDTYLIGFSMGAQIGDMLIRQGPQKGRYAGHLAACAPLAGSTALVGYSYDARVLFDYFFPGVLPGNVLTSDFDFFSVWFSEVHPAIVADPAATSEYMAVMDIPWTDPVQRDLAALMSLVVVGGGSQDFQDKAKGNPYDNRSRVYSGSSDDLSLNAAVDRFEADPRAVQFMRRYYDPAGSLGRTRVLHLHDSRDPTVPLEVQESAYQRVLEAAGETDQYVLRTFDRSKHCSFSNEEILTGFDDLVQWVKSGVAPTP